MEGKTHLGLGMFAYVVCCSKLPGKFHVLGIVVSGIASLLPDLDHPKGIINQYILPVKDKTTKMFIYISLAIIVLWIDFSFFNEYALKCLSIFLFSVGLTSHRNGLSHSLTGLIIFTIIAGFFGEKYNINYVYNATLIGYASHLIGDMFTKQGVPLLYPFSSKKFKMPLNYRVGSKEGKILEEFLLLAAFGYIIYMLV